MAKKELWDEVYSRKRFGGMWYPNEGVVRFTARYLKRRVGVEVYDIKREIRRVLDVGCGNGRHIIFFAEQGFNVYGIDISEEAIKIAKVWLSKKNLTAELLVSDIESLPFVDDYFDVIISFGVLDHITFSKAKSSLDEIKRVLAPDGYVYITLRSTEDAEFGRGKKVDHNTFVLEEGYEKELIQHYFDLEEIKELFEGLKIFDIELHEERFPALFTIDKAFLQSSQTTKRYIELSKLPPMDLKYSRWHIVAEK